MVHRQGGVEPVGKRERQINHLLIVLFTVRREQ
jgi:hypothetical protein